MKIFSHITNFVLYIILLFTLTAAIGTFFLHQPFLMSVVRSYSMYPLFERGDIVFVERVRQGDSLRTGDIIIFAAESGELASQGWIVHRIVGGDEKEGFITKGDHNPQTDQASGASAPVKRDWIVSRVILNGDKPLVIPLIGYLPLWAEGLQRSPFAFTGIVVTIAAVIGVMEGFGFTIKSRFKKKRTLEIQSIYFVSGITVSILICAMMLASSQFITLKYAVSEHSSAVMTDSAIGMIQVGDEVEQPLADLKNQGFLPIVASVASGDPGLRFSHPLLMLNPGHTVKTTFHLKAIQTGSYSSVVQVALFYPLLPKTWIHQLHQISYVLALSIISVMPGLPLMAYPLIHPRLRRKTIKQIRSFARRLPGIG